jgi:hypothetical protein
MINDLKIFIGKLSQKKVYYFLFIAISFSPIIFAISSFFNKYFEINSRHEVLDHFFYISQKSYKNRTNQKLFIKKYENSQQMFEQKYLESHEFLKKDKINLEKLCKYDSFKGTPLVKNRLNYLNGKDNRLHFNEELCFFNEQIKETLLKQEHPIEADEEDLKQLLSIIDEKSISKFKPLQNSPQLIIENFELEKSSNGCFLINSLNILKREFLK